MRNRPRSKSRRASTTITLSDSVLSDFTGNLELITLRRPWWRRLLRLRAVPVRTRLYGHIDGTEGRVWRRR